MNEAIKYTLIALAATISAVTVKKIAPEFGLLITIGAVIIIAYAFLGAISVVMDFALKIEGMLEGTEEAAKILFKVLGITLLTKLGGQICRDAGEGSLALKIEMLGGALAIVTALPLLSGVLAITSSFIKR